MELNKNERMPTYTKVILKFDFSPFICMLCFKETTIKWFKLVLLLSISCSYLKVDWCRYEIIDERKATNFSNQQENSNLRMFAAAIQSNTGFLKFGIQIK